jgi:hypothetical protein
MRKSRLRSAGHSLFAFPDRLKCTKLDSLWCCCGGSSPRQKAAPLLRPKAFVMSDPSHHPRAKLKELVERASIAAEINFKKGNEVAPKGFAIRENGSRFVFKPIPASNAETVSPGFPR